MKALLLVAALVLPMALAPVAAGGSDPVGPIVAAVADGLKRPGISVTDARGGSANVEIADFYFAGRVTIIDDETTVLLTNANLAGGNRHSVVSSDWGSTAPVLPVIGQDFGGGAGFKSGELQPGDVVTLTINTATLDPEAMVLLATGDVLIAYHCYIHGAAQMNAFFLVDK